MCVKGGTSVCMASVLITVKFVIQKLIAVMVQMNLDVVSHAINGLIPDGASRAGHTNHSLALGVTNSCFFNLTCPTGHRGC